MTLKNIKEQGFTIVELLIVIVVIGILAAITIVAYTGITNQARDSKAVTAADSMRTVAEAFNSQYGRYPATLLEFTDGEPASDPGTPITKRPTTITALSAAITAGGYATALAAATGVTATNGETTIAVYHTGADASPTGGVVIFWDYKTGALSTSARAVYYGSATSASTDFDELT